MAVRELRPGLWHWQAPHPGWTPDEGWPKEVSSYAIDDGAQLLLFDPLSVPDELLELAADREPVVVLTAPWHERETQSLVERLGVPVYAPPPDTAADLMHKFGITAEQAGEGSPDLVWLRAGDAGEWHPYAAGDRLPFGISARETRVSGIRTRPAIGCPSASRRSPDASTTTWCCGSRAAMRSCAATRLLTSATGSASAAGSVPV